MEDITKSRGRRKRATPKTRRNGRKQQSNGSVE